MLAQITSIYHASVVFSVYLQTKPEVVLERLKRRSRPEEQEIPLVSVVLSFRAENVGVIACSIVPLILDPY